MPQYVLQQQTWDVMIPSESIPNYQQGTTVNVVITAHIIDSQSMAALQLPVDIQYKLSTDSTFTDAGTFTTDGSGNATVQVPMITNDTYNLKAIFSGNSSYQTSTGIGSFTPSGGGLTPTTTTVHLSSTQTGGTFTVTASGSVTITGDGGVSGAQPDVQLNGTDMGTTLADSSGNYSVSFPNLGPGTYTVDVIFDATSTDAMSSAQSNITVGGTKTNPTKLSPAVIGGLAAAGIVTVGLAVVLLT